MNPKSDICADLDTIPVILEDKNPKASIWAELLIRALLSIVVNLVSNKEDDIFSSEEEVSNKETLLSTDPVNILNEPDTSLRLAIYWLVEPVHSDIDAVHKVIAPNLTWSAPWPDSNVVIRNPTSLPFNIRLEPDILTDPVIVSALGCGTILEAKTPSLLNTNEPDNILSNLPAILYIVYITSSFSSYFDCCFRIVLFWVMCLCVYSICYYMS